MKLFHWQVSPFKLLNNSCQIELSKSQSYDKLWLTQKYVHCDRLRRVLYCSYCIRQFDYFNQKWKAFLWAAISDSSPEIKVQ